MAQAKAARQGLVDFAAGLSPQVLATVYPEGDRTLSFPSLFEHLRNHTREHAGEMMTFCGSLNRWGRAGMRDFLVRQHTNLMDAIGGMSEAWLASERVAGDWTTRDVLAHVLCWEEFVWAVIKDWPQPDMQALGHWLVDGEATDPTNARLMAEKNDHTLIEILDWLTTYHRRTLRTFDAMSNEELCVQGSTGFGHNTLPGFLYDMAMHTAEHAADIWRHRPDVAQAGSSRPSA